MRRSPGTDSIKISCRLPSRSAERKLVPVVLPSGRASDHVVGRPEDRNCCRRSLCRANSSVPSRIDDIDVAFDKICRKFRNPINELKAI